MRVLAALAGLEPVLGRLLRAVVFALVTALATVVVLGVAFRKAGAALVWYDEVAVTLLAWLTFYGASLAALTRSHIGFPKIMQSFPPRLRIPLIVVREVVIVGFFVLIAWAGFKVMLILGGHALISLPWVPARLTQSVIPVGAILFILAELVGAARLASSGEGAQTSRAVP